MKRLSEKPELNITFSDPMPGSFIVRDGVLLPNLDDEAMKKRQELKDKKDVNSDEIKSSDNPESDKPES